MTIRDLFMAGPALFERSFFPAVVILVLGIATYVWSPLVRGSNVEFQPVTGRDVEQLLVQTRHRYTDRPAEYQHLLAHAREVGSRPFLDEQSAE